MQRRALFGLAVLALVVATAACGAGDAASVATTVRDSAGITIVENTGEGAWEEGDAWRLSAEPAVDIGVLEGAPEYQLFRVRGAARLSDGRIVVANAGTHELRFYDATGRFLHAVGGQGEGPGEFQRMGGVHRLPGDSLLVADGQLARLSVHSPDGEFVRSLRLESDESVPPRVIGVLSDGTLVTAARQVFIAGEAESGVHRDSTAYLRYRPNGELVDTIGTFPGSEAYVDARGTSMSVTSLPFGRATRVAVGGDRFYAGATDRWEFGIYSPSGGLDRRVRMAHASVAVTPEDVNEYKQQQLADARSDDWRRRLERMLAEMPIPESFPAFSDIHVDATGRVWVEAYRRPGDEQPRWSVFDPDGRLLGTVATPRDFDVLQIGEDYILGRATDELDVEHVRLYDLEKPVGAGDG